MSLPFWEENFLEFVCREAIELVKIAVLGKKYHSFKAGQVVDINPDVDFTFVAILIPAPHFKCINQ